jgi:hypothetical protein
MSDRRHFIPIWFFIGLLLTIYGVLILGSGIYELGAPAEAAVQNGVERNIMASLHMAIWWGALLIVLGLVYAISFRPRGQKP